MLSMLDPALFQEAGCSASLSDIDRLGVAETWCFPHTADSNHLTISAGKKET